MNILDRIAPKITAAAGLGGTRSAPQAAPPWMTIPEAGEASGTVSTIGADMKIVGQVVSDGVVKIFGRMEGELRASIVLISDAAQFEGSIVAEELTIRGHVKGTIHAIRVKLDSSAVVHGDIFHRSLSIEEKAQFEGSSRRHEHPTETSPAVQEIAPKLQPQMGSTDAKGAFEDSPADEVELTSAS